MRTRFISRALAATAVTAMGAAGLAGMTGTAHASAVPRTATAPAKGAKAGTAKPRAAAALGAKPYDFNGDGHPDLALGDPYGTVGTVTTAGFVTIVYGSATGPDTTKKTIISQATTGVPGTPEAGDHFGFSLTSLDYDEDGYADLLVGAPDEDTTDGTNAGSETILWGSPSGLNGTDSQAAGEPSGAGANHRFGYSLLAADFDGDGHTDWVDTSPGDSLFWPFHNLGPAAMARTALAQGADGRRAFPPKADPRRARGHGAGVKAAADTAVTGFVLAAGDVDGDGKPDLAIGWQDTDAPTSGFDVWHAFTSDGPTFANEALTRVDALAVGDFDGDGFADVATGGPDESAGVGGHVTVYKGDADVTLATSNTLTQDSTDMPGPAVAGDHFGHSLAAGDVDGDGKADLAVGVPYRTVTSQAKAGELIMLYGAADGLSGARSQAVSQDTAGVPGAAEANDELGWTVILRDLNADGHADLVGGAPKENGTDGAVTVLPGGTDGVTATGSATWGAGTLGVTGVDAQIGVRQGRDG